jgi:DNA-binding winged helix-turn-helix (wHTH) protein/Tol biopolymer transport system component
MPDPDVRIAAFAFGSFKLDLSTHQLLRDGEPIALTPKAFDLLAALIRNRGRVMTKEDLMAAVWPNAFVTDDSLTQNVWAIRRALGDDSAQPLFVTTLPRVGYRFVAEVTELPEPERPPSIRAPRDRDAPADSPLALPRADGFRASPRQVAVMAAVAVALTAAAVFVTRTASPPAVGEAIVPVVFSQGAPAGTVLLPGLALSPDGRALVFVAQSLKTRRSSLWLRDLGSGEVRMLAGTEGAEQPFWSPKSTAVGFFANGQLKTLDLVGSNVQSIAAVGVLPQGASWGAGDTIIFAPWRSALLTVPAAGGVVAPLVQLDRSVAERWHRRPQFLPDGRHYLYAVLAGSDDVSGIYVGTIGSTSRRRLFDSSILAVQVLAPDRLLALRGETLLEARLDESWSQLVGTPRKLEGRLVPPGFRATAGFTVSPAGLLAFGGSSNGERLMEFTREGKLERVLSARSTANPALSPGGDQVVTTGAQDQAGVWLVDLQRDVSTRIMSEGAWPAWSPDGTVLAFGSTRRAGIGDIYLRRVSGEGEDQLLLQTSELKIINDWSRDGRYIVFVSTNDQLQQDLWLLPMFGERTPIRYLQTGFNQIQAQVSPNGRWLAYSSDESGRWEVYLQSFPVPGTKITVSADGGGEPKWSADGRELFYVRADMSLMSVGIPGGDPSRGVGESRPLFTVPVVADTSAYRSRFTVSARGNHFVFNARDEGNQTPITVLVNWEAHPLP